MLKTFFFDTETTGLVKHKLDPVHPQQPMPVQIGMKLDDENRIERGAANLLICPHDRWIVGDKAAEVTGIDNKIADAYGIELESAIDAFLDMIQHADRVVAHNIAFDLTVMRRAVYVYCQMTDQEYKDPFAGKVLCCTMHNSTSIVKAPPYRNGAWKWPRLEECMRYFFNEELDGAHDALVDVRGCARVYYELIKMGVLSEQN